MLYNNPHVTTYVWALHSNPPAYIFKKNQHERIKRVLGFGKYYFPILASFSEIQDNDRDRNPEWLLKNVHGYGAIDPMYKINITGMGRNPFFSGIEYPYLPWGVIPTPHTVLTTLGHALY